MTGRIVVSTAVGIVLLVSLAGVGLTGQASPPETHLTSVSIQGPGAVTTANGTVYVWGGEPITVSAVARLAPDASDPTLCVERRTETGTEQLGCRSQSTNARGTAFVVELAPAPTGTAAFELAVTLRAGGRTDAAVVPLRTISPDGDLDGDGLSNGRERALGTDPALADTDGDGVGDAAEVRQGRDPAIADTDRAGDGPAVIDREPARPADLLAWLVVATMLVAVPVAGWWWRSGADGSVRGRAIRSPPVRSATAATATGSTPPTATENGDGSATVTDDVELLPPDQQVLRLVDEHGGQVRQVDVVDRTGWSKAKVSRVLSRMEEDGQVVRYRIGRGNVVARPGDDPSTSSTP